MSVAPPRACHMSGLLALSRELKATTRCRDFRKVLSKAFVDDTSGIQSLSCNRADEVIHGDPWRVLRGLADCAHAAIGELCERNHQV